MSINSTPRTHIQNAIGKSIEVNQAGTINISPSIELRNFLLILNLSHKLLSISQLTKELNSTVLMTSSDYIVKDAQTGAIIGRGTKRGLYYVDEVGQKGHTSLAHGSPNH